MGIMGSSDRRLVLQHIRSLNLHLRVPACRYSMEVACARGEASAGDVFGSACYAVYFTSNQYTHGHCHLAAAIEDDLGYTVAAEAEGEFDCDFCLGGIVGIPF